MDTASSPVSGGSWKSTREDGSVSVLLESGDLRDAIAYESNDKSVTIGVFDNDEIAKAFAHNTGYEGHPHIPNGKYKREFIPEKDGNFVQDINDRINNVIELAAREDEQSREVEEMQRKADEALAVDLLLEQRNNKQVTSIITSLFGDIFNDEL